MKKRLLLLTAVAISVCMCSCGKNNKTSMAQDAEDVALHSVVDTLSWVLGEQLGKQFAMVEQMNELKLDPQIVEQAFCTAYEGKPSPLDEQVSNQVYQMFTATSMQRQRMNEQNRAASMAQKEAECFKKLEAENPNAKKDASGIYYEVVRQGQGRKARIGDRVRFDYKGYNMLNNELFDQTYGNREPIVHVVAQPMFEGLLQGLQLMNAGSIYRLYVPSNKAFGAQGTETIPPYTPVIYEVELHNIFDE